MSKMPDPVAIYKPEYGICWTSSGMAVEAVDGIRFITTTQAEAYAAEKVREALEISPTDKALAIYDEGVKDGLEAAARLVDGRRINGLSTDLYSIVYAIRQSIPQHDNE